MEQLNENATNEEIVNKVNEIINFLDSQSIINVEVYNLLGNMLKTQNLIEFHCINGCGGVNVI